MSDVQKYGEEFKRVSKDGFDAGYPLIWRGERGPQAIAAEVTDYSKKSFEDGTRAPILSGWTSAGRLKRSAKIWRRASRTAQFILTWNTELRFPISSSLIANELITNAAKYANPDESGGTIWVTVAPVGDDDFSISVRDEGVGLPPGFALRKAKGLGMRIINSFVGAGLATYAADAV